MLTTPSGSPACPDIDRQFRLAAQLTQLIPGAAAIRVSLTDPRQAWPHPHAVAMDAAGRTIRLSRATGTVAARWILRSRPEVDWTRAHTFDLTTAKLARSDHVAAGRSR